MSDCPECGQENYGSPSGSLTKRIAELEAEREKTMGYWRLAVLAGEELAARAEKAEAEVERLQDALALWHNYNPGCHGAWISCDACQSMIVRGVNP